MTCAYCAAPLDLAPTLVWFCSARCAESEGWVRVGDGWERL